MSKDIIDKFGSGISISQTAERTRYRGVRRLIQRNLLRRERLLRVLNTLGYLPPHFSEAIDFEKHFGQFKPGREEKIAYNRNGNKYEFLFMDSYGEMLEDFRKNQPALFLKETLRFPMTGPFIICAKRH